MLVAVVGGGGVTVVVVGVAVGVDVVVQRCQETVSQGKTSSGQGRQTDRSTLKSASLASVKANHWKIAVGQGRSPLKPSNLASVKVNYWKIVFRQGCKTDHSTLKPTW